MRTDFKARYHGTIGGFVWALMKPVAMFLVLLAVFSFIFASDPVYKRNLLVVTISLAGSVLFLRYRDLNQVWEVVTQAGFFVAPIIYPFNILPERFHAYLYLWPPTPIIQFARQVLATNQFPTLRAHGMLAVMSATIFIAGSLLYRRYAPRAVEYV